MATSKRVEKDDHARAESYERTKEKKGAKRNLVKPLRGKEGSKRRPRREGHWASADEFHPLTHDGSQKKLTSLAAKVKVEVCTGGTGGAKTAAKKGAGRGQKLLLKRQ